MSLTPAVLEQPQLQKFDILEDLDTNFTDRCARTPDTCRYQIEGFNSIFKLSNSHFVTIVYGK
jgi:hypothetical protein